ncbi:rod shape-determining protein MreD [Streptacidiphilus monticola]|uniref:Rod shape-determining protein MreD n=1 Tax=Streptacidiphilus monticola TaxID=2161674 RepID=A0ABW1G6U1_9ACTN
MGSPRLLQALLLSAVLVVVALVVQVSILARLGLPGAAPDLLLLVVLGLALVWGHTAGALVGFGAGLLADLAPPSDHAVGRYALVLCLVGYVAGLLRPESGQLRSVLTPLVVVAVAAVGATVLYAAVGALVGDTAARHVGIVGLIVSALVYDLLLAPFVVPGVMALARRCLGEQVSSGGSSLSGGAAPRSRKGLLNRRGSLFGVSGSRTGGEAGLGTLPGFGSKKTAGRS